MLLLPQFMSDVTSVWFVWKSLCLCIKLPREFEKFLLLITKWLARRHTGVLDNRLVRWHTGVQVYSGIYLERRYAVPAARTRCMNCLHTWSSYNCLTYASKSSKALNSSPILKPAISFMNECSREVIDRIKDYKRQYYSLGVQAITE